MNPTDHTPIPCRVCGAASTYLFAQTLLGKHRASYYRCDGCGHVQTEQPHWLEEAYQNLTFHRDVGMVGRSINTARTTTALAWRLDLGREEPCLDWGGGTGLFVRVCRDYGLNYFYYDRYARNIFASGFAVQNPAVEKSYALVSAFEVAEHLPDPIRDFGEILRLAPRFLLFSTLLYQGQGSDWWYFLDDGQHVAFYTRRSLEIVAARFGYVLTTNDCDLHLFARESYSHRLLDGAQKHAEKLSERYKKKHGSRLQADFGQMSRLASAAYTPTGAEPL